MKKAGRKGLSRRPAQSYPALSVPPGSTISAHSEQLCIAALCREYGGAPPHGSRPAAHLSRRHQLPVSVDVAHKASSIIDHGVGESKGVGDKPGITTG